MNDKYIKKDGFLFTSMFQRGEKDAIIIKIPYDVPAFTMWIAGSKKSLDKHIAYINKHQIDKAIIVSDNIEFILKCPTLKYIKIIPSDLSKEGFDYSPLYNMKQIKYLSCQTQYGLKQEKNTEIDCSRISGLENIHINNSNFKNYNKISTLKTLGITGYREKDLINLFNSDKIDTLHIMQSKIETLKGLDVTNKLQCLYLEYNRYLKDISELIKAKHTIKLLKIIGCPKVENFEILSELNNLEFLEISGSNSIPSLNFIKKMKNLKTLILNINIEDGDLSPCLDLSYVYVKGRRHYNLKENDLPRKKYIYGNENIEEWRRNYN